MTTVQMAMLAAGLSLLAVSFTRSTRWIRAGTAVAAGLGFYAAWATERPIATLVAALLLVANVGQLLLIAARRRQAGLNDEEQRMASTALPRMDRLAVRGLLDQGLWIDGKAGETLIREGEPTKHLFYLSEGEARVESGGRPVAAVQPGQFLGEITVLNGQPATGTVVLAGPARFWCVGADALQRFLAANPGFRPALESAFAGNVAEKLRLANARIASEAGGAATTR